MRNVTGHCVNAARSGNDYTSFDYADYFYNDAGIEREFCKAACDQPAAAASSLSGAKSSSATCVWYAISDNLCVRFFLNDITQGYDVQGGGDDTPF